MLFSCQRIELSEQNPALRPGEGVYGEAKISFSALLPTPPQTKAMGEDPTSDIESMHLVIFDGNIITSGYIVNSCICNGFTIRIAFRNCSCSCQC